MKSAGVLAVVPARGGSKGIPRKNLRTVGGVSLIERAVGALRRSGAVDEVLVSTDDVEIAEAARTAGANVPFLRPPALASDTASTVDVLAHAVSAWIGISGIEPEWIVLAEPTNPFRRPETIAAAVARARAGGVSSVIAVCPLERKPQYIFARTGDVLERYVKVPAEEFGRRQEMEHLCRLASVVWVVRATDFIATRRLLSAPTGYVPVDGTEAINIDEPLDLDFADFLARKFGL